MFEVAGDDGFREEPPLRVGTLQLVGLDLLDRHGAIDRGLPGGQDDAHPTLPESPQQRIVGFRFRRGVRSVRFAQSSQVQRLYGLLLNHRRFGFAQRGARAGGRVILALPKVRELLLRSARGFHEVERRGASHGIALGRRRRAPWGCGLLADLSAGACGGWPGGGVARACKVSICAGSTADQAIAVPPGAAAALAALDEAAVLLTISH